MPSIGKRLMLYIPDRRNHGFSNSLSSLISRHSQSYFTSKSCRFYEKHSGCRGGAFDQIQAVFPPDRCASRLHTVQMSGAIIMRVEESSSYMKEITDVICTHVDFLRSSDVSTLVLGVGCGK